MLYDVTLALEEKDLAFIERWTGGRGKYDIATMGDILIRYFAENPAEYEKVIKSWGKKERES